MVSCAHILLMFEGLIMNRSNKEDFLPRNILKEKICNDLSSAGIQIGLVNTGGFCFRQYRPVLIAPPSKRIKCKYINLIVQANATVTHYNRNKKTVGVWFYPDYDGTIDRSPFFGGYLREQKLGHLAQFNLTSKGIFLGSGNFRPISTRPEREIARLILESIERHDPKFAKVLGPAPRI